MSDEVKIAQHNHSDPDQGGNINASSVAVNNFSFKLIKATRVSEALKAVDGFLENKQDKLKGKDQTVLALNSEGSYELPFDYFAKKIHSHDEFLKKEKIEANTLLSYKDDRIVSSGISIEDIRTQNKIFEENNNSIKIAISSLNKELEEERCHSHDNYIEKKKGDGSLFILNEEGELVATGLKLEDVATKKDLSKVIMDFNLKLDNLNKTLNSKSEKDHSHDFKNFVNKSEMNDLVKTSIKTLLS
jgi:hypothetical protein